jgi:flagellar hook-length control protein FliK
MQNLILNNPSRINQTAGRQASSPEQSGIAEQNNAFEQVLNKQVNARQQKLGRTTPEPMQQVKTKAPKLDNQADANNAKQAAQSLKNERTDAADKANIAQAGDVPNALELMWANVMSANQLAKPTGDAKSDASSQEIANSTSRVRIDLNATVGKLDLARQSTTKTDATGESLIKADATLSSFSATSNSAETSPVIPDDKLPTEQVRWLDLPINRPAESNPKTSHLVDTPFHEKPSVELNSTELASTDTRLVNADAAQLTQEAETTADIQATMTSAIAQTQATAATNPSALAESKAAGSSNHIQAYLGQADWHQAINQKVMWMIGASEQTAVLTLNPPDLGPLQVVISVNNDQADTTFISANPDVRQALQDGLSNLRDKLNESGLQLGQANINANLNSNNGNSSMLFNGQQQQTFSQAAQSLLKEANHQEQTAAVATERIRSQAGMGLVDTFV